MIQINFMKEQVCGEPGPNLYWYGTTTDFFELSSVLHILGRTDKNRIILPCIYYGKESEIYLISKKNGRTLNRYLSIKNRVIVELDMTIWRIILTKYYLLSIVPGREYIDLEEFQDIKEEANFIIDSQAEHRGSVATLKSP